MKKYFYIILIFLFYIAQEVNAQITPQQAVKEMIPGINIGNTFDGGGSQTFNSYAFDDYKNAGFHSIRISITWDSHLGTTSPYTIQKSWLDYIETVVNEGLKRDLYVIINAHHDDWIKNNYTEANKARFDSLWSQISIRFGNKPDKLLFEILNEPQNLSLSNINNLNARTLKTIRKTNPTRIVIFSGTGYTTKADFLSAAIPANTDKYLIGYFHEYWGWPWSNDNTGTPFSASAISGVKSTFDQMNAYTNSNGIPVMLGEWGFSVKCDYNPRMLAFATYAEQTYTHSVAPFVWDDGGNFGIYNRSTRGFDNDTKDIITHFNPKSPNNLSIGSYADSSIILKWTNRTLENDSIIIERKLNRSDDFIRISKLSPNTTQFIDLNKNQAGTYYYRLRTNLKDTLLLSYPIMIKITGPAPPRTPYLGSPVSIPGTIEAENFDNGGEGVAYHYASGISTEKQYRPNEGIDIGTHGPGLYQLGYIEKDEWTEYTINVKQKGTYNLTASVAAGAGAGGEFNLKFRKKDEISNFYLTTGSFKAPNTSAWATYANVSNTAILDTGVQIMRMTVLASTAFNLDYVAITLLTSDSNQDTSPVPTSYNLFDNYPNPFNPATNIKFNLPKQSFVSLKVFDELGKEISVLIADILRPGTYTYKWSPQDLASGIYFYRIQADTYLETKKMLLLK